MNVSEVINNRYSTKAFDPNKKISEADFNEIKNMLRMSPSSTNLQPWHFVIAHSEEGKNRIAKSTEGPFHFNTQKIKDASHVVVFCSRIDADEPHMLKVLEQEDKDGRYATPEQKQATHGGRTYFANIHRYELKDLSHWMDKQVYLNMGSFLLGVAAMGIDALPMEGVDVKVLDEEFGLREKGFTALAVVSLGYREDSDFNSKLPKSRLQEEDILTVIA